MPRWVKVSLIVVTAIVALLIVLTLLGGGDHGPSRHMAPVGGNYTTIDDASVSL